jgi:hypothetical protein
LDNATVLVQQLAIPSHSTRTATMLLDPFDFCQDLHTIAEKDRRLELPFRDSDQGERGGEGFFATESRQHTESQ